MDGVARWQADEAAERPERFGPEEWQLRLQLALCYRIFARLGWTELIYNHITLRLPGEAPRFLINPFGLLYDEVTASSLVCVDLSGRATGEGAARVNPAGFVLHGAIHEAMPAAHCIMHVHTTAGMAVASSEGGLSMSNFYAAQLRGQVAYHDFEGITLHEEEKARIVASLGGRHCLILRNHGLLAQGETVAQAFAYLWTLNRACEVQLAARAMGEVIMIPDSIAARASVEALQFDPAHGAGWDIFNALRRRIEREEPDYRS